MKIRQAIENDYSQIAALHCDSFSAGSQGVLSEKFLSEIIIESYLKPWQ